jgi:hypothetical protein
MAYHRLSIVLDNINKTSSSNSSSTQTLLVSETLPAETVTAAEPDTIPADTSTTPVAAVSQ